MTGHTVIVGDVRDSLRTLDAGSAQCVVTSPPYWGLRDYGHAGQLGLERTPEEYVQRMAEVFREVRRVLRDDGTLWLNLGDTYINAKGASGGRDRKQGARRFGLRPQDCAPPPGLKRKDLVGIPWRVAFALQADGWYLRSEIIWHKPNAMPDPSGDRPARAHEHLFLLTKSVRYRYDASVERRSVWSIPASRYRGAHFATFPEALVEPCILAGSRPGDTVLDPFVGSGTTLSVALRYGRSAIGCELNPHYAAMAEERASGVQMRLAV